MDARIPGRSYAINTINDLSPEALGELRSWLEGSGFQVPISQIVGFQQFTAQVADRIYTDESTSSSSFGNLATVGPQLTKIPDGRYVVLFGCWGRTGTVGAQAIMGVKANADEATDDNSLAMSWLVNGSSMMATTFTLKNSGGSTLTCRYRATSGSTASFGTRWLVALRFGNP